MVKNETARRNENGDEQCMPIQNVPRQPLTFPIRISALLTFSFSSLFYFLFIIFICFIFYIFIIIIIFENKGNGHVNLKIGLKMK